jgi:seryl-tRNA synthetase
VENPQAVKEGMQKRNKEVDVDGLVALDKTRRELVGAVEALKARQNKDSKLIPQYKKEGRDVNAIFAEMKEISDKIKEDDQKIKEVEEELNRALLCLPNLPGEKVPYGKDSEENIEIRKVGEPAIKDYPVKPHWEIGSSLNILDPETAAKVTGARFHFYRGLGARLERSIINYFLNTHTANGYTEIFPPFMVNRASMTGTGQLPKFEEDAFSVAGTDYFLIPTAEVPVTNMYRDTILKGEELPLKFCAYSACFRAEAGSAGRDTRGLIRQHQFNKVELVQFVEPEKSYEALESLTKDAEQVLQGLGLPYRVMRLCSGDLGFSSAQTYDIEVWMPSYGRYVEISSCSNFVDFQARRASIKYKNDPKEKAKLVHTLNGSGVAIGRTVAAILENFQNPDGTVTVPEVLRPFMGVDIIK